MKQLIITKSSGHMLFVNATIFIFVAVKDKSK